VGGVLAGTVGRVAAGLGIVGCAAVIAFSAGGGGLFGGLGGLFGSSGEQSLQVAKADSRAADILAAPIAGERATRAATGGSVVRNPTPPGSRGQPRQRGGHARPSPSPPRPASGLVPVPVPAPSPAPAPGGGQMVSTVGSTVTQIVAQAPPQAQPLTQPVDNAVDALAQTCVGLPVCP
jgi:hypothetical protein